MRPTLTFIAAALLVAALIVGLGFGGLLWRRTFEPQHRAIDREVFEATPSFVHGKIQHISRLRLEYERSDSDLHRESLRTLILHEAAVVDASELPANIRTFLDTIR